MQRAIAAGLIALALAGCGGQASDSGASAAATNKAIILEDCLKRSDSSIYCECSEQVLAEKLPEDIYTKLTGIMTEKGLTAELAVRELDPETEQKPFFDIVPNMMECALKDLPTSN